ncbi:MAG: catalase family protein [Paraclostridium sp.]
MVTESELLTQEIICILEEKLRNDYPKGETKRDAHPKGLGLVKAYFAVPKDLPKELKVGIFQPGEVYPTLIRFSSGGNKVKSDKSKDIRGIALKLIDVPGKKYSIDEKATQDFILLTIPTMPIGTLSLFRDFIYYLIKKKNPIPLLYKLIKQGKVSIIKTLIDSRKNQTSPLDVRYWSTTPYMYGDRVVKYSVIPKSNYKSELPKKLTDSYLTENMKKHLESEEAVFDFVIQFQTNDEEMPINDSSVEWSEEKSPCIKVGEITIPKQIIKTREREEIEENLSFSPGHTQLEHQPVGDINLARARIYKELSKFRHNRNKKKLIEPTRDDFIKLK